MDAGNVLSTLTFTIFVAGHCVEGTSCYSAYYYYSSLYLSSLLGDYSIYCEYGCCGYYYSRTCCLHLEGGAIAGIVIGCLIALGLIISLVICIICVCRKKRGHAGTVRQPGQGQNITMQSTHGVTVTTSQTAGPQYPQQSYPQQQYPVNTGFSYPTPQPQQSPAYNKI